MNKEQFEQLLKHLQLFFNSSNEAIKQLENRALLVKTVDEAFIIYELIDLFNDSKKEILSYINLALSNKASFKELVSYRFESIERLEKDLPRALKQLSQKELPTQIIYH